MKTDYTPTEAALEIRRHPRKRAEALAADLGLPVEWVRVVRGLPGFPKDLIAQLDWAAKAAEAAYDTMTPADPDPIPTELDRATIGDTVVLHSEIEGIPGLLPGFVVVEQADADWAALYETMVDPRTGAETTGRMMTATCDVDDVVMLATEALRAWAARAREL